MSDEQLEGELVEIAKTLRRDDADRGLVADQVSRLVDRLRGFEPPRRTQNHRMTVKGRSIEVQRERGHFGL